MATTMSISEARAALTAVLDQVEGGGEVTITRHGRPVAVVVRPDALRSRRVTEPVAQADRLLDLLHRSRRKPLAARPALDEARADELVAEVRRHRSRG